MSGIGRASVQVLRFAVALYRLGKAMPEEFLYRFRGSRSKRSVPMLVRNFAISRAPMEIAQHGVPEIRAGQPRRRSESLEDGESGLRPLPFGDRNRLVQSVQR